MDVTTAIRLCDEVTDFCEGWAPAASKRCSDACVEGAPCDLDQRVASIRESVLSHESVSEGQAEVLRHLAAWIRRVRQPRVPVAGL